MLVAIEGISGRNWLDFSDPVSLSWRFSTDVARSRSSSCDLLCLGDSLAKHGIIPSVIEGESGLKTVNLAAARCPTLMSYFVLRRALEAGAHPSAIIINTKQAVLLGSPEFNARYWPAVLSPQECLELGTICGRAETGISALMGCLLPSLRSRLEIRSNLLAALRGEADPLHEINRLLWRNWTANHGANVASLHSGYHGELSPEIKERLHPDAFYVDRSNAEGIERLLQLASDRKIRVFWLLPPLTPELQAWRDRSGAEAKFEEWVRSHQSKHPRSITVLDARRVVLDPAMFVDATHLAGGGAVALSRAVGTSLKAEIDRAPSPQSQDWVVLDSPKDGGRVGNLPPIEDIDESKRILRVVGDNGRSIR